MRKLLCPLLAAFAVAALPASALGSNGGTAPDAGNAYGNNGGASPLTPPKPKPKAPAATPTPAATPPSAPTPPVASPVITGSIALLGNIAKAAPSVPPAVQAAVRAGNRLRHKPYRYGGGHQSFKDTAYDCSGAVSYVLHGAGLLPNTMDSSEFEHWGAHGAGTWITVYANPDHAFIVVGGLRLDTSGPGDSGPRWRPLPRSTHGFVARHPVGF